MVPFSGCSLSLTLQFNDENLTKSADAKLLLRVWFLSECVELLLHEPSFVPLTWLVSQNRLSHFGLHLVSHWLLFRKKERWGGSGEIDENLWRRNLMKWVLLTVTDVQSDMRAYTITLWNIDIARLVKI